ncbi:hypothetical protein AMTR_s01905p00009050, partial [Amborella trichopoda]
MLQFLFGLALASLIAIALFSGFKRKSPRQNPAVFRPGVRETENGSFQTKDSSTDVIIVGA